MRSIIFSLTSFCIMTFHLAAQEKVKNTNQLEQSFELTTLFLTPHIPSIDEDIAIYSNTNNTAFFYAPVILPDWNRFKKTIDSLDDKNNKNQVFEVPLLVYFQNSDIDQSILKTINAELIKRNKELISSKDLHIVPHAFYQIYVSSQSGKKLCYSSVDVKNLANTTNLSFNVTVKRKQYVTISGSKNQLTQLYTKRYRDNTISGKLFSQGYSIKSTNISMQASKMISNISETELFGDETLNIKNSINTSNAPSGGFMLNLGFGSFGGDSGGSTKTTTTESRQRIVSRDFINKTVQKNLTNIDIKVTGDPKEAAATTTTLTNFILSSCNDIEMKFVKDKEGAMKIGNDVIGYTRMSKSQVREIISAAPKTNINSQDNSSVNIPKVGEFKKDKKGDRKTENSIQWTFDGEKWTPTKVDVYLLNEISLKNKVNISWSSNTVSSELASRQYSMTYPAAELYNGGTDFLNATAKLERFKNSATPIGTVISSLIAPINLSKIKQDNVIKWVPADGRDVSGSLFSSYTKRKNVPDLRGMFLRGLNTFENNKVRSDSKQDPDGNTRVAGDFQNDEFKNHSHTYLKWKRSHRASKTGNERESVARTDGEGATNSSAIGGKETRPKNIAVYYYIRIN